ncbi:RHS repeat-associated core domain-containing protein [Lysobacter tyrosinilyticus]
MSQTEYDATYALPIRTYSFGKLQQSLTYDTTSSVASGQRGTLSTISDGRDTGTFDTTVILSDWKRGTPRAVKYPVTAESPSGATQAATVNDDGTIESVTDENGYLTGYNYDAMGRLASITYPTGDAVSWAPQNREFRALKTTDWMPPGVAAGQWREYVTQGNYAKATYFDAVWRPVLTNEYDVTNVPGTLRSTSVTYDTSGRVAFQSYPSSDLIPAATGTWSFYDALDRIKSIKQDSESGQLTIATEYLTGFKTKVTNPRGFQTVTEYQSFDRPDSSAPTAVTRLAGADTQVVEIQRDVFGKPLRLTKRNEAGSVRVDRHYVYGVDQRLCKTIEPETDATVFAYDEADNLSWSAAGLNSPLLGYCDHSAAYSSGRRVERYYDARNRLRTLIFPDSAGNQTWNYTPDGLPASIATLNSAPSIYNGSQVINTYTYNKRRLLTGESTTQPGWYTWSAGYSYNSNAHLMGQTYPTGLYVDYAPNALGQATKSGSYATGVTYYPNGAIKQFTYGNGIVHTMAQNARQLPARVISSGGTTDLDYGYDANGNVTSTIDNRDGVNSRWMNYDGVDRLTGAGSVAFGGQHWHFYTYDAVDNIRNHTLVGIKNHDYFYDATNRLTNIQDVGAGGASIVGLGYDPQGNLKNKNGQAYVFDYGNRLREITGQEGYRYDGSGRRVLASHLTQGNILSMYGQAGQLLFDQNLRGKVENTEYIYLGGSLIASRTQNSVTGTIATKYQHTDALGSPVAVTNEAGQVIDRTQYEPFGAAINKPDYQGPGYTGHVMDAATGLTYMQQRYYDPQIGRFLSIDPVAARVTGDNFNRYSYAGNSPYTFTDPDGREIGLVFKQVNEATNGGPIVVGPISPKDTVARPLMWSMTALIAAPLAAVGGEFIFYNPYTATQVTVVAGEAAGVTGAAGAIRGVNAVGGTRNCVNCAIATDALLAGRPASAMRGSDTPISVLETMFGAKFGAPSQIHSITATMAKAGNGARGIVFGTFKEGETGHVFNVVNQGGVVRYLDGQTGKAATLTGYEHFKLLRTNP